MKEKNMALIKCTECGKEISDKAEACPNCGCPVKEMELPKEEIKEDSDQKNLNLELENQSDKNEKIDYPKKKKKIGLICGGILVAGIAVGAGVYFGTANSRSYNQAMKDYESKSYEKAISEFETLGDYKDSSEMVLKATYNYAKILYKEEKFDDAKKYFEKVVEYKDAKEYISDCEYQLTVDGGFMKSLSKGLMARWDKSDDIEKNGSDSDEQDIYSEYCNIELKEIEDFYEQKFENKELGRDAQKYIDLVREAKDATKYYTVDYNVYSSKWDDVYAKRTVLLKKFVEEYGLTVDKEYQETIDGLLVDASAAEEQQKIKESIEKMIETFSISAKEDEWGNKTYKLKMKNTTDRTFKYFYADINVIDADGNIIGGGNMGQIESWEPGQEAVTDVYFDTDTTPEGYTLKYTPHYNTGEYYE